MPRLQEKFKEETHKALKDRFQKGNDLAVPRLQKIVISMGVGQAIENKNRIDQAVRDLSLISGQKPVVRKAKKSVAGFRLRAGMPIGTSVTLRRARMYEFLDRLISIVIPRIRDFRGLPRKLDGRGNYSLGLGEQTVFPEIDLDKIEFVQGMNITMVTTAQNDEEGFALLESLGVPFRK